MQTETAPRKWKVFLINGLAQNAQHWNPHLLKVICARPWVHGVATMDLPGAGKMAAHRSPTLIPEYPPLMRQLHAKELATDGSRLLVALSLGGMVAAEWCAQFPGDFQKLILINTSFGRFALARERLQPAAWLTFASVMFGGRRSARERRALGLVSNDPEKRAAMLPVWIEARRQYPMRYTNAVRQLIAAKRYVAPERLPKDSVIVCSRHDRVCLYAVGERIARHYGVRLVVDSTPGIGHAFHVDGAEELAAIIESCVNDAPGTA